MSDETDEIQDSANRIEKQLTSPTVTLILTVSTIGALIYLGYLLQPAYRGDTLPYALALAAELFIILQGLLSFWTILSGRFNPRNYEYHSAQAKLYNAPVGKTAIKILKQHDPEVAPPDHHSSPRCLAGSLDADRPMPVEAPTAPL